MWVILVNQVMFCPSLAGLTHFIITILVWPRFSIGSHNYVIIVSGPDQSDELSVHNDDDDGSVSLQD